jgi:hypothetical protein|tara:strand:+ start:659 stop:847 length:189 start_codon:yes stop_codon:yes gene_type:complete
MPGNYYTNHKLATLVIFLLPLFVGFMLAATAVQGSWRLEAAQTECAQFNPQNGQFQWLEDVQ